ncbi:MAG: hypothetical protein KDC27_00765, partial [Acidobacteria bacterium]|nr:hypothetical protein [Acidobacteriota bacterium]
KRLVRVCAAAAGLALASGWAAGWITGRQSGAVVAVLVLSRTLAALLFRADRLHWRDLSLRDTASAALACLGGSAIAAAASAGLPGGWPARTLAADCALYGCLVAAAALLAGVPRLRTQPRSREAVRTLLWGAGVEGRTLLDRIRRHNPGVEVFGWLDDDPVLAELDCDGLPVLGPLEALPLLVELHGVKAVLVAIPGLSLERRRVAEDLARWSGARLVFSEGYAASLEALAGMGHGGDETAPRAWPRDQSTW